LDNKNCLNGQGKLELKTGISGSFSSVEKVTQIITKK